MPSNEKVSKRQEKKPADVETLLRRYGMDRFALFGHHNALYERHLVFDNVLDPSRVDNRERFEALARSVRDVLSQRWIKTEETYAREDVKRVYYLSMEYLIGRSLANNMTNLLLSDTVTQALAAEDIDWRLVAEEEPEAGLGNGGLGRLAACFLDSMATMAIPATGYGLRYEYGLFTQTIRDGWQQENADNWLLHPDPWEVPRPDETVEVKLNCGIDVVRGRLKATGSPSSLIGMPYDRAIVGYGGKTIGTLRLWAARAPESFDFQVFSHGDFVGAVAETLEAESITRVLYPDDSTTAGQGLRFVQEYFLVACSIADLIRRFKRSNSDWSLLPDKVAIQLNDTHPAIAVPELMRVLLDDARLSWDQAWDLTQRTLAYTNHTLLAEALEKWPVEWFHILLPRHLEIIYEINRRLLAFVNARYPGDGGRLQRTSLIEEGPAQHVRMAHLAITGSHSTNGVSEIHSQLLRTTTVRDLADLFPERFTNKTNGVSPRRWLLLANPALAATITDAIGDQWITNLGQLGKLKPLAGDAAFVAAFRKAKRDAKHRFCAWVKTSSGQIIDPETVFDCQIKRIHEYKRQMLNALRIVVLYNRIRNDSNYVMPPRTFFFAGKAAPAYTLAKLIIKFIENLAATINANPVVARQLRVLFLPEYDVSLAARLIPAADVSNQISTAGYEASGTSNMKFMMNGALTIGTRDGATIEMAQAAGEENFWLFGLTAEQVASSRSWYNPRWHYDHDSETRAALDLILADHFSPNEHGLFAPIGDMLLTGGDHYMHLADLNSYLEADGRLTNACATPDVWTRKAILNVAASGRFSSDRTIAEYASQIWDVKPCPIP